MPTGYTDCIKDDISLRDFILRCSRAMGALIMMRDESTDTPIPERFEPSDYHAKKLVSLEKELADLKSMEITAADAAATKEYEEDVSNNEKYIRQNLLLKGRYSKMLSAVKSWEPPTKEHFGLKSFMQEQIESSIKFDCGTDYYSEQGFTKLTGQQWKEKRLKELLKDLSYHTHENDEEVSRTEGRNLWIKQLRESLPINTMDETKTHPATNQGQNA